MTRPGIRYRPATVYGQGSAAGLPRAVHLVDAENLLGTAAPRPADVAWLTRCYAGRVGFGPMDQVVIACSHLAFTTIGFCWRGPQYLLRSGPDGADLALLTLLRHDRIATRFPHVVIASGDHIFAPAVTGLRASGCQVTLASRRGRLSRTLKQAASGRVIYLDAPSHLPAVGEHAA